MGLISHSLRKLHWPVALCRIVILWSQTEKDLSHDGIHSSSEPKKELLDIILEEWSRRTIFIIHHFLCTKVGFPDCYYVHLYLYRSFVYMPAAGFDSQVLPLKSLLVLATQLPLFPLFSSTYPTWIQQCAAVVC